VNLTGTWQIEYHDNNGKEVDTLMISLLQSNGRLEGCSATKLEGARRGDGKSDHVLVQPA
jgi:hypothetical protein